MAGKKGQRCQRAYQTTDKKRGSRTGKKRRSQRGGFLNRYDFAYAGRDTVNQVRKIVSGIIKQATDQIDKIVQDRINQVIRSDGAEYERVFAKILRGVI